MIIDVDEKVGDALKKLEGQASARKIPYDRYLELIATAWDIIPPGHEELGVEEMDAMLDKFADLMPATPPLPAEFSRRDIYADHD